MSIERDSEGPDDLVRLIRQSRVLDPLVKRQWLRVLPNLTAFDALRLRRILESETSGALDAGATAAPHDRP
ncbi:MAG: hypothetical protein HW416_1229 [Chloroflexi bacterium]|nr:hypothetical protein [Chloroflexota bacterium]